MKHTFFFIGSFLFLLFFSFSSDLTAYAFQQTNHSIIDKIEVKVNIPPIHELQIVKSPNIDLSQYTKPQQTHIIEHASEIDIKANYDWFLHVQANQIDKFKFFIRPSNKIEKWIPLNNPNDNILLYRGGHGNTNLQFDFKIVTSDKINSNTTLENLNVNFLIIDTP
ncbi:MAG: hypothetical protein ACOCRX_00680 [Candidatus Woesearchaeota archaeon]